MKISNNSWIIIVIAAFVLAILVSDRFGIDLRHLFNFAIPIAVIGFLLISAKCCVVKMQESKTSIDLNSKITLLKESMDRVEKKLDKIDGILEKVSE